MAGIVFEDEFFVEDVTRRHLRNGDKLNLKLENPWTLEKHLEAIPLLGRRCKIVITPMEGEQPELDMDE